MNQTMLRQLLWIFFIFTLTIASSYTLDPEYDQCRTPPCAAVEDILTRNVDFNVEPCDDFYKYACGKNHSHNRPLSFTIDTTENQDPFRARHYELTQFKDILKANYQLSDVEQNLNSLKIEREIFKRCGKAYSGAEKKEYESWLAVAGAKRLESSEDYRPHGEKMYRTDLKAAIKGIGFAFFEINIVERENTFDQEFKRYIEISPTMDNAMALSDLLSMKYKSKIARSHQNRNSERSGIYSNLQNFIKEIIRILPDDRSDDFDWEEKLPEPITIDEWQTRYNAVATKNDTRIEWHQSLLEFFGHFSPEIGNIRLTERIIVKGENFFFRLAELLRSTKKDTVEDYILLRLVSKTIGLVDKDYKQYSFLPPIEGFEYECVPGLLIGAAYGYTQKYFPKDNHDAIREIYLSLKSVIESQLGSDLNNNQATSNVTRNFLRQLSRAEVVIGYPPWLMNDTFAANFYGNFQVQDSYFKNQLDALRSLWNLRLFSLRDHRLPLIDINTFFKSLSVNEITFSRNMKQILIPSSMFSENTYKLFSAQLYDPINYGAAGTAIATALYTEWLRKSAFVASASECIREQIPSDIYTERRNEYTLRSTASLLGAHAAYLAWGTKDSYPIEFVNFGAVTDFKLFFLSYAMSLCRAETPPEGTDMAPHNFIKFAVSNMPEFTEAFRCFESHTHNRRDKCDPLKH